MQVTDYQRGWFSSNVTSLVTVKDPLIQKFFTDEDASDTFQLVLEQHIQHGPFFYSPLSSLPSFFGWAAVSNKWKIMPSQQAFFSKWGVTDALIQSDQSILSFLGNYINRIKFNDYYFYEPQRRLTFHVGSCESDVNYHVLSHRLLGEITLADVSIDAITDVLVLPAVTMHYDLIKSESGIWSGTNSVVLPEISLSDAANKTIKITGLTSKGVLREKNNEIRVSKTFSIKQLQLAEQLIGPIVLQVSLNGLNAENIVRLFQKYKDIQAGGELYESQLKQNILLMLPSIVMPGANFQIDKLVVATPKGQFDLQANLFWPKESFARITSISDLVDASIFETS